MAIEKIHRDDTTCRRHRESYWIFEPFGMNIDLASSITSHDNQHHGI